jgi:hypothetical protein
MRAQVATFAGWPIPSQFARSQATKKKKKRKRRKTASLRVAHDAKFPSFFPPGDSSITKQNK